MSALQLCVIDFTLMCLVKNKQIGYNLPCTEFIEFSKLVVRTLLSSVDHMVACSCDDIANKNEHKISIEHSASIQSRVLVNNVGFNHT